MTVSAVAEATGLGCPSDLRWWEILHQHAGVDSETSSEFGDVVEAEVPLASLDLAEERPVDAAELSGLFLAQPEFVASIAKTVAKQLCCDRDRGSGHIDNLGLGKSMGLEMIYPNCMRPDRPETIRSAQTQQAVESYHCDMAITPTDTSDDVAAAQVECFQAMTGEERFALAVELSVAVIELAEAGIRLASPGIGDSEVAVELLARLHGTDYAEEYRSAVAHVS